MIKYHMIAMLAGFVLDLLLGDPEWLPHPVQAIGAEIAFFEKRWNGKKGAAAKGRLLVALVLCTTLLAGGGILLGAYWLSPYVGIVMESIMTCQILAAKSLRTESMRVYHELKKGDLKSSRYAVSRIVGRDTEALDEHGVTRAAVETVAENASDGVIAPMIYTAIGGPVLGLLYKAINTMDSMVGYKDEKYREFGRAAAKLDDVVNFIPARISAVLLVISCFFLGRSYDAKRAWKICLRDRFNHASPNSAQTEAACAGALGIQLAGDASYFGKVIKKPTIGDPIRPVTPEDIRRANRLMYFSAFLCQGLCLACMGGILLWKR